MVKLKIFYITVVLLKAGQDTENLSFRFVLLAKAELYYYFILKK